MKMKKQFDKNIIIDYLEQYSGEDYTTVLLHLLSDGDVRSIREYTDRPDYKTTFNKIAFDRDSTRLTYDTMNAMCYGQALMHGVPMQDALLLLINNISRQCSDCTRIPEEVSRMLQEYAAAIHDTKTSRKLSPLLNKAAHYIEENLCRSISLKDLSAHCGCSTSKLQHAFRQELGINPKSYIRKMRIQKACHWLENSHMTSLHVSLKLGYCSQSYFIQDFKRETGMTPGAYVQNHTFSNAGLQDANPAGQLPAG